jgi:hypothetical protein
MVAQAKWQFKGQWPLTQETEITYDHFEDMRKMMFGINWIMGPENLWNDSTTYSLGQIIWWIGQYWELIQNYDPDEGTEMPGTSACWKAYPQKWNGRTTYVQGGLCKYQGTNEDFPVWEAGKQYYAGWAVRRKSINAKFYLCLKTHVSDFKNNRIFNTDLWQEKELPEYYYAMRLEKQKGIAPPKGGWIRIARRWVYSDFNYNSGCYDYDSVVYEPFIPYHAYMGYPPQFNQYARRAATMPDGRTMPLDKVFGKYQQRPFEFSILYKDDNGTSPVMTGHIGAQYVEMHPPDAGWLMFPPWYWPYKLYQSEGIPYKWHPYYDKKMRGWQSCIEAFVEKRGGSFFWPLEGQALWDAADGSQPTHAALCDNNDMSNWNCNRSAFEKCLKIIGSFDWYLDTNFAPDPYMYKLTDPRLALAGCWRRTWRYSFGPPRGILWPSEKGDPPFYNESYDWWCKAINVVKAYEEVKKQLTPEDISALWDRHFPRVIVKAEAQPETPDSEDWEDDYDYFEEVDRYIDTWKKIQLLVYIIIQAIDPGAILEAREEWGDLTDEYLEMMAENVIDSPEKLWPKGFFCFELRSQMVQDMKDVLDCLRWISVPVNYSQGAFVKTNGDSPPFPPGYFSSNTWQGAIGVLLKRTDSQGAGAAGGVGNEAEGTYGWEPDLGKYQYFACINYTIDSWLACSIHSDQLEYALMNSDYDSFALCFKLYGAGYTEDQHGPSYYNQWSYDTVKVSGGLGLHATVSVKDTSVGNPLYPPIYAYVDFPAEKIAEDEVEFEIHGSGSFPSGWKSPHAQEPPLTYNTSHYKGFVSVGLAYSQALLGINPRLVELGDIVE